MSAFGQLPFRGYDDDLLDGFPSLDVDIDMDSDTDTDTEIITSSSTTSIPSFISSGITVRPTPFALTHPNHPSSHIIPAPLSPHPHLCLLIRPTSTSYRFHDIYAQMLFSQIPNLHLAWHQYVNFSVAPVTKIRRSRSMVWSLQVFGRRVGWR